jgi:hypothetical protein
MEEVLVRNTNVCYRSWEWFGMEMCRVR